MPKKIKPVQINNSPEIKEVVRKELSKTIQESTNEYGTLKSLFRVRILNSELFYSLPVFGEMSLYSVWEQNHKILLKYLEANTIPYFGLHGTPTYKNRLNIICPGFLPNINPYKLPPINIATFYERIKTEYDLFQVYSACNYVYTYSFGRGGDDGQILVFNFGEKNPTIKYEPLLGDLPLGYGILGDNKKYKKFLKLLEENKKNTRYRSDINMFLVKNTYVGSITSIDVITFFGHKPKEANDYYARGVLELRLRAQLMTLRLFELLKG